MVAAAAAAWRILLAVTTSCLEGGTAVAELVACASDMLGPREEARSMPLQWEEKMLARLVRWVVVAVVAFTLQFYCATRLLGP